VEARAGHGASDVFPGNGKLTSHDEEIRRLRRENAQLREERDILGKATAFFARNTR
jgi:transposase